MECGQLYMYCYFVGLSPFLVVDREFSFFFFFACFYIIGDTPAHQARELGS